MGIKKNKDGKSVSKREQISDDVLELMATKFRLLGEPTRLSIIRALMLEGEMSVGQLVQETQRTHANVSKHLKHLFGVQMLTRRKEGLQVFYTLSDPLVEKLCHLVCDSILEDAKRHLRK